MKVTFLGTGTSQGIPVIACICETCLSNDIKDKRLRSSIMVELNDKVLVIDSGPDFRQQLLTNNVQQLDAILFTHEHKDHIAGLDDVRAFNWVQKKPMDIYAEEKVIDALHREYSYVFVEDKYPGIPKLTIHHIDENPFEIEGIKIVPIRGMHMNLPVLGYRINNFTYLTDMNFIEDQQIEKIIGSDILVINALRKKKHKTHFNLDEALEVIDRVKPKQAYLTHISHLMGFQKEVSLQLPSTVSFAHDGLVLSL